MNCSDTCRNRHRRQTIAPAESRNGNVFLVIRDCYTLNARIVKDVVDIQLTRQGCRSNLRHAAEHSPRISSSLIPQALVQLVKINRELRTFDRITLPIHIETRRHPIRQFISVAKTAASTETVERHGGMTFPIIGPVDNRQILACFKDQNTD